jgi:D-alanyl-D-alanine carboxypeptidase (penicillin-binding protein 5/6)
MLGTDSEHERARSGRRLLDFGFKQFETRLLYRSGASVATLPVWQGENDTVALGVNRDTWITLPRGGFTTFSTVAVLPQTRFAPVTHGETLGHLALAHNGQPLAELPLVALSTVPEGGLAKRSADRLRLWFRGQGQVQAAP